MPVTIPYNSPKIISKYIELKRNKQIINSIIIQGFPAIFINRIIQWQLELA